MTTSTGSKAKIVAGEEKPARCKVLIRDIPAAMKQAKRWVAWQWEKRSDKWTKVPINPATGRKASSTNAATWTDCKTAWQFYRQGKADGIGFVLGDGWAGIDLDDCRNDTGELAPWSQKIVDQHASYTEVSPTGTGVKIFVRGTVPPGRNRTGNVEMYSAGRYFATTGQHLAGTPATVEDRQGELDALHAKLFPVVKLSTAPSTNGSLTDDDVLRHAKTAANANKFEVLWNGGANGQPSPSEADLALCSMLAFWCNRDTEQIDRLFRQSGRMRQKWDRADYRQDTLAKAAANCSEVYTPPTEADTAEVADIGQGVSLESEAAGCKHKLTLRVGSDVAHVDEINLAKAAARQAFIKAVGKLVPDLDAKALEKELLTLAAQAKSAVPAATGPELDVSAIVRPEQFYHAAVSGLTVAVAREVDGKLTGTLQTYLAWQDGERECVPLREALDLPAGKTLWFHPELGEPAMTTPAAWSARSREFWLAGDVQVNPADLFRRLRDRFLWFIDLPADAEAGTASTATLWTMLTYTARAWASVPYLAVLGPMASGKTRLFEALARVVFRPLSSSSMTAPALFRTLHANGGTVLLDEAERLKQQSDPGQQEVLAMLLCGYRRGGQATRLEAVGDTFRPVHFDVFGCKAVACINGVPPVLASRCIAIAMLRAAADSEKPKRRLDAAPGKWQSLRDDLHCMALNNGPTWLKLAKRDGVCPPGIAGRDFELWQPLLAIASWIESHGEHGLLKLMQNHAMASIAAGRDESVPDADQLLLELLANRVRHDLHPTAAELLEFAKHDDDSTFAKWSPRGVAARLKSYGIAAGRRTTGGRREIRATVAQLAKIGERYDMDLGLGDTAK